MPDTAYNAAQIRVLKGLEAVRRRPAMYIGSTSARREPSRRISSPGGGVRRQRRAKPWALG